MSGFYSLPCVVYDANPNGCMLSCSTPCRRGKHIASRRALGESPGKKGISGHSRDVISDLSGVGAEKFPSDLFLAQPNLSRQLKTLGYFMLLSDQFLQLYSVHFFTNQGGGS